MKELEVFLNKQIKNSISQKNSETVKTVIDKGKQKVDEVVYDVYQPRLYERSGQLRENWDSSPTADGVAIENVRIDEETGKNVTYTVATGSGYDYEFEYSGKPRDFIEATREDLRKGNELKEAVKKDLKKNGIEVR